MNRFKRIIIRFLVRRLYRNLRLKVAITLVVLMSMVVLFLGVSLLNNSQTAIKNSVLANHREIVTRAASEVNLFFAHIEENLNTTATLLSAVYFDPWRQETVLVGLALEQPIFSRVSLLDLSGNAVASSDMEEAAAWLESREAIGKILDNKIYISKIEFHEGNHTAYLTMAVPVRLRGKISGTLIADITSRGLWDIVDRIKLNETGRAFLVSGNGMLLVHPDKKEVLRRENLKWQKDINDVVSGKTGSIEWRDITGKRWVSSYAPLSDIGWGIVLRQEQKEAYLFSRIMKLHFLLIIILGEAIAIILAIVAARLFVRPIKSLLKHIKDEAFAGKQGDRRIISRRDEIGQLIKAFNDLTEKLKRAKETEKFSSIGEAAAWVAHELKNSLTPIKSFIQLLPARHKDEKFIGKFRDIIPDEISRCERMLKELSDFSSPFALSMAQINISGIMDNVLKIMEDRFVERGIKIQIQKNSHLNIWGDSERIKQVFVNLIINAINAMPEGGRLSVGAEPVNTDRMNYVEVKIKDTGVGISEERLKNIFEPFKTTRKDGTGLGLAISRKIIEQHRGYIRAESRIGEGTAFTIGLPVFGG